ncbi:MAG: peroxiredoxin [Steroidobacteraceae bacterium]
MNKVTVGKKLPAFSATQSDGTTFRLADARGRNLVLYFYPRDMTPGCTTESQNFRDLQSAFRKARTDIIGISRDSVASHQRFRDKEQLPFQLLADVDEKVCKLFDVIKEKNMYGKKVMGIERSTFLIDGEGVLRQEWRKVKVPGHADEVLTAAKAL